MMIKPVFFAQHVIDFDKVEALKIFMREGGNIPPVVAVDFGGTFMPIDGHHRFKAASGLDLDAWVVTSAIFERLDRKCRDQMDGKRAEDYIMRRGSSA